MPYKKNFWIQTAKEIEVLEKATEDLSKLAATQKELDIVAYEKFVTQLKAQPFDPNEINLDAKSESYAEFFGMKFDEKESEGKSNPSFIRRNLQNEVLVWYPRNTPGQGYTDQTVIVDGLQHLNIQDLLARFFIKTHAQLGKIKNWRRNVIGCTSLYFGPAAAGAQMPMFDYDGKNVKKIIRKDVKILQKEYGLGDAWVYETRRGFHVYFFCDVVSNDQYKEIMERVQCCKGFKKAFTSQGYAVLRVSAKYTDFDIKPLYVLRANDGKLRRMTRKAHTIRALLDLGEKCGTHFAILFPQWAYFEQDSKEWKPPVKKPVAKRIKKAKSEAKGVAQTTELTKPTGYYDTVKFDISAGNTYSIGYSTNTSTSGNGTF